MHKGQQLSEEKTQIRKDYLIGGIKMNIVDIKHIEHQNEKSIPTHLPD